MKLATFTDDNGTRIGLVEGSEVVDVTAAAPDLPKDMTAFLAIGARQQGQVFILDRI